MATFIDKSAQWRVGEEIAGYGIAPAMTSANVVEFINPTMDANTESIEREVLKNSLVKARPVLGKETSSGSMGLELSSVVAGVLNGSLLYKSAMGVEIAPVAAVAGTTDGTVFSLADTNGFEVGQAVKLTGGTGTSYAVIRSIVDDTSITYAPASAVNHTSIAGLLSYRISTPSDDTTSLTIEEYFENGSNQVTYTYNGVVVSDMSLSFPIGNIVKADFSVAGAGFSVASGVGDRAKVCKDLTPYIAKNMTFTYGGTAYAIDDLSVNVASDIYDSEALTTDGLTNKTVTGKSNVGGSFSLEYNDTNLFAAYQAQTSGALFGTVTNAGTTMVLYAPNVILSQSGKSVDGGFYKDSADFTALSSSACADGVEDALTIAFE
jgi:hypothetical protein